MIEASKLENILNELLPGESIRPFDFKFIKNSHKNDEKIIYDSFDFLMDFGFSKPKLASCAYLLAWSPETLDSRIKNLQKLKIKKDKILTYAVLLGLNTEKINDSYKKLQDFGFSDKQISIHLSLLGRNLDTIKTNYEFLLGLGLTKAKIRSRINLVRLNPEEIKKSYNNLIKRGFKKEKFFKWFKVLGMLSETIDTHYDFLTARGFTHEQIIAKPELLTIKYADFEEKRNLLKTLGLTDDKINSQGKILTSKYETLKNNYQKHLRLLRKEYTDRNSGRQILAKQPQLLSIPHETLEANIQYMNLIGLDWEKSPLLLGTTAQLKQKKVAFIFKNIFNFKKLDKHQKRGALGLVYTFLQDNPDYLVYGIPKLQKKLPDIRDKIENLKKFKTPIYQNLFKL